MVNFTLTKMDTFFVLVCFAIFLSVVCDSTPTKKVKKSPRSLKRGRTGKCKPNMLAEYNLSFFGDWSPRVFTKMYPKYRPPAQWSTIVGRSHDVSNSMWSLGGYASSALKAFAETGDLVEMAQEVQSYGGILDAFTAAAIPSGMGRSSVRFMADGVHNRLSFVSKIVPSPDWFVGVDSLDLCAKNRWKQEITLDLFPIDAGTDQGMTHTSPNWQSYPAEKIFTITSSFPSHPANSFYYPERAHLPRLAHVVITKVSEYKRRGKTPVPPQKDLNMVEFDDLDGSSGTGNTFTENSTQPIVNSLDPGTQTENRRAPFEIVNTILGDSPNAPKQQAVTTTSGLPKDCLVTDWTEWTPCSKTCGFGTQERYRDITQRAEVGGLGCPIMTEEKICGGMRSCKWKHFDFFSRRG